MIVVVAGGASRVHSRKRIHGTMIGGGSRRFRRIIVGKHWIDGGRQWRQLLLLLLLRYHWRWIRCSGQIGCSSSSSSSGRRYGQPKGIRIRTCCGWQCRRGGGYGGRDRIGQWSTNRSNRFLTHRNGLSHGQSGRLLLRFDGGNLFEITSRRSLAVIRIIR